MGGMDLWVWLWVGWTCGCGCGWDGPVVVAGVGMWDRAAREQCL